MTTSKLHPAAVRAAKKMTALNMDFTQLKQTIHDAIDDHLKSKKYAKWWLRSVHTTHRGLLKREGWEELRETATDLLDKWDTCEDWDVHIDRVSVALRRVRGKKP